MKRATIVTLLIAVFSLSAVGFAQAGECTCGKVKDTAKTTFIHPMDERRPIDAP